VACAFDSASGRLFCRSPEKRTFMSTAWATFHDA
jgi:hypothetical protein